jgi:4-hydroxy-tetrahydrodipicolinate synthase
MSYTKPSRLKERLHGVNVIMVTPFDKNGEVDIDQVKALTRNLIENGIVDGKGVLVANGSFGECFSMSIEERKRVVSAVVDEADTRVPVVVGCNETNTGAVVDLAKYAQSAGADGVMIMPPYYLPVSNEEILNFYKKVSQSIDIGIVLYNNEDVSVDISLEVLKELAELENVVGLKDCTHDIIKFKLTACELKDNLVPLNGVGELIEPLGTLAGTKGFFTLVGNFIPELVVNLWRACEDGEYEKAELISLRFIPFIEFQRSVKKPIQACKKIMRDTGLPGGYVRSPLTPLTEQEANMVERIMHEMDAG